MLVSVERGKLENPEKNPRSRDKYNNKLSLDIWRQFQSHTFILIYKTCEIRTCLTVLKYDSAIYYSTIMA